MTFKQLIYKILPCIKNTYTLNNEEQQLKIQPIQLPIKNVIEESNPVVENINEEQSIQPPVDIIEEQPTQPTQVPLDINEEQPTQVPVNQEQSTQVPVENVNEEQSIQVPVENINEEQSTQVSVENVSEEQSIQRRSNIIDNIFLTYKEKYHEFYSNKQHPIHPHFNEKMFKNLCNQFTFSTHEELIDCLNKYNNTQKQNKFAYNQLTTKRKLKCDIFNFYLFI